MQPIALAREQCHRQIYETKPTFCLFIVTFMGSESHRKWPRTLSIRSTHPHIQLVYPRRRLRQRVHTVIVMRRLHHVQYIHLLQDSDSQGICSLFRASKTFTLSQRWQGIKQGIRSRALICSFMFWADGKGEFFRVKNKTSILCCEWIIICARASWTRKLLRLFCKEKLWKKTLYFGIS